MKLLVTGATGFVGRELARYLTLQGYPTLYLLRPVDGHRTLDRLDRQVYATDASIIEGDLRSLASWCGDPRLQDVTHVISCAAVADFSDRQVIRDVNLTATVAFATWAAALPRLERFCQLSSAWQVTAPAGAHLQEDEPSLAKAKPLTLYGGLKRELETRLLDLLGSRLLVVRPPACLGTVARGCTLGSYEFFWMLRLAQRCRVFPIQPTARLDIVGLDEVARAVVDLLVKPTLAHSTYHLSTGLRAPTFATVLNQLEPHVGEVLEAGPVPVHLLTELTPPQQKVVRRVLEATGYAFDASYTFDDARVSRELGYRLTPLDKYVYRCLETTLGVPLWDQVRSNVPRTDK